MGFFARFFTPPSLRLKALEARIEGLEAAFPRYDVSIRGLIEECEDLLERSERKRGRAAADLSAATRLRGSETPDESETPSRVTPEIQAAAARLRMLS